ncbi:MAG: hypothetical protein C5B44_06845 [Acidobacteria bacterium]|nr:MAG: hypothetical protein C5B44_06845 [Acidobacteriota bacterium]
MSINPCSSVKFSQRRVLWYSSLTAVLLFACVRGVTAQNAASGTDWVMLSPEGEEFSISMPKQPTTETGEQTYHKMQLKTRLYLSAAKSGPVLAVASMSGIKSNPALYSEFQRLNSYVDAFKDWFPEKIGRKAAMSKLSLVSSKTLNGNEGRVYRITIGDLSGVVEVYATRKRFYAVTVLNTTKDNELQERFLSSFILPEKSLDAPSVAQQPQPSTPQPQSEATITADPAVNQPNKPSGEDQKKEQPSEQPATDVKPQENADAQAANSEKKRGPINGGVLNSKALYLPKPDYPAEAYQAKASGSVIVQVTIDEQGSVIAAHAVSGHMLLQGPCVAAARQARFSPTTLMGEPVKVTGVITYHFGGN